MKSFVFSWFWALAAIIFITPAVSAQSVADVKLLFNHKYNENYTYEGTDDENFYFVLPGKKNASLTVRIFDKKSGDAIGEKLILLSPTYKKSAIVNYRQRDGQIYVLSAFENSKDDKVYFFSESFDIMQSKSNGDLKKVSERPLSNRFTNLLTATSPDKEYFAYFSLNIKDGNVSSDILTVYDSHFQVAFESDNVVGEMNGFNSIDNFVIDNNGQCYMLLMNYKNAADMYSSKTMKYPLSALEKMNVYLYNQLYEYKIVKIEPEGEARWLSVVAEEDKFIKKLFLFCNGNEVFTGGVFSKPGNLNDGGTFSARIDNQPEEIYISDYFEFSDEFVRKDLDEKDLKLYEKALEGDNNGLYDYHFLNNLGCIQFNGGVILLMEQVFAYYSGGKITYYIRLSDYVYAVYIGQDGKMKTTFKIPKKQATMDQRNNNCAYTVMGDKFLFLFDDLPYNSNKSDQMFLYEYDKDLNRTTHVIPTGVEFTYPIRPTNDWVSDDVTIGHLQYMTRNMFFLINIK